MKQATSWLDRLARRAAGDARARRVDDASDASITRSGLLTRAAQTAVKAAPGPPALVPPVLPKTKPVSRRAAFGVATATAAVAGRARQAA
jgi:hypothetical protein